MSASNDGGWYASTQRFFEKTSIARFDADGAILWAKNLVGNRFSSCISATTNGVLVFGNHNFFPGALRSASAVLLSAEGNIVREQVWHSDELVIDWHDAARLPTGEILVVGSTFSATLFEQKLLLAKFSSAGEWLWEKYFDYGDDGSVQFEEIIVDPSGDFYLLGPIALARFNSEGDPIWGIVYEFEDEIVEFSTGAFCSDGSLFLIGGAFLSAGNNPLLLLKIGEDGQIEQSKGFLGDSNIFALRLFALPDGLLQLAAISDARYFPVIDNDNLVIRFDCDGNLLESMAFGSDTRDYADAATLIGGRLAFSGRSSDTGISNTTKPYISIGSPLTSGCEKEYAVVPFPAEGIFNLLGTEPLTFTRIESLQRSTFTTELSDSEMSWETSCESEPSAVVPVIFGDDCELSQRASLAEAIEYLTRENIEVELRVFDMAGRLVRRQLNPQQATSLSYSKALSAGMYIYNLQFTACGRKQRVTGKLPILQVH